MWLTARRLIVAMLAVACMGLALMWPTWRPVLAQVGGYSFPGGYSIFGCATDSSGQWFWVVKDGPYAEKFKLTDTCIEVLDKVFSSCKIVKETQAIDPTNKTFGIVYQFTC